MVPLGIITIISGSIRVAGPRFAKAFIGRARENRATAEVELMSSVSNEVCEMFNGNSIVRAIGKPRMAHFLLFPDPPVNTTNSTNSTNDCNIHTIKSATLGGLLTPERKSCGILPIENHH